MKIPPAIVLVKNINSAIPRTHFSESALKQAAELILQAEGITINPLILSRRGLEHYEVVEGHFEYYAALTAKEMDLRRGETINAYIIEVDNENLIRQQIAVFRKTQLQLTNENWYPIEQLNALDNKLSTLVNVFMQAIAEIRQEISVLQAQVPIPEITITMPPQPIPETGSSPVEVEKSVPEETLPSIPSLSPDEIFLKAINTLPVKELYVKLSKANLGKKTTEKIIKGIEQERRERPFESISDIKKRVSGLGPKNIQTIRKLWN